MNLYKRLKAECFTARKHEVKFRFSLTVESGADRPESGKPGDHSTKGSK